MLNKIKTYIRSWLEVPDFDMPKEGKSAGQPVNQESILTLSAAWACVKLISDTIGTLPIHVYRRSESGRERADEHELNRIIRIQPNSETLASTYWQTISAHLLLHGNSINRKLYYKGKLVGLKPLAPGMYRVEIDENDNLHFYELGRHGEKIPIPKSELFRVTGFSLNGRWGVSPIEYGTSVFGSAIASGVAASKTFENGMSPTIAFTMDKTLTKEQRESFRENLIHLTGAINSGKSPILEGGMKAQVLSFNPKDAQLLESRVFNIEEICRLFSVDPSLIGHGKSVSNWGTGLEQKMITFLMFTLRPWLTKIEQSINAQLFTPEEQLMYYAEFNIEGLLRADSTQRAGYLRTLTDAGIMTRDEARLKENLPPMGGNAAKLMVNSATQPVDSLGVEDNDESKDDNNEQEE